MDEERRLFYVAVTRAKDFLFLTYSSERGELARAPSPYLFEILDKKIIDGVPYINETLDQASVASKNKSDLNENKTNLEKLINESADQTDGTSISISDLNENKTTLEKLKAGLNKRTPEELYTMKRNAMHMLKRVEMS